MPGIQWNTHTSDWKFAEQRGWTDWYHVSPRANRESIQNLGLMGDNGSSPWGDPWKREQPVGNYFFTNPGDAQDYANILYQDKGTETPEEERWTWPEAPEGFDDWEPDRQDAWHDENEPQQATEDPNGYDVWKVNARDLPIHRDPESAIVRETPMTPSQLREDYRSYENPMWDTDMDPWAHQLMEHMNMHGETPARYYTPEAVDPSRVQLHQHIPGWDIMNDEGWSQGESRNESGQVPESWDEMMLRRPQFPAHSSVHTADYYHIAPTTERDIGQPTAKTADAGTTFNPVAPIDELTGFLEQNGGNAVGLLNPNNPLSEDANPNANTANPQMNPSNPQAFNNPANPQLNQALPTSQTNPANPQFNPSVPGSQNNPSNPMYNPSLPSAVNNSADPNLNPNYPGSMTNPSNPIHNPDWPNPEGVPQKPMRPMSRTWTSREAAEDPWDLTHQITCPACGGTGDNELGMGCDECGGFGHLDAEGSDEDDALYHAAPTQDRARIQQHGLQLSNPALNEHWRGTADGQPEGVYFAEHPSGLPKYDPEAYDVWSVSPKSLGGEGRRDNLWGTNAWSFPNSVPSELLRLHEGPEHRVDWNQVRGSTRAWTPWVQVPRPAADKQSMTKRAWNPFHYEPNLPSPEEMAQGKMCRFHPDRPAVIATAFAPMCEDCYARYQQAERGEPYQEPRPVRMNLTSWRFAARPPRYMYHVAPGDADIQGQGLIPHDPGGRLPKGVYLFHHPDNAQFFRDYMNDWDLDEGGDPQPRRIWKVDTRGLDLYEDPAVDPADEFQAEYPRKLRSYYTQDSITPDRLSEYDPYVEWMKANDPQGYALWQQRQAADIPGFEMGDSKDWPDPTEPRSSEPPAPPQCTCAEGHKLDCPVHGLHATDPENDDLWGRWHLPQGNPVGFPQGTGQPRGWATPYTSSTPLHA